MARLTYKEITFPEGGYSGTFEEFTKEFEDIWVFARLQPKDKKSELKIAFKAATGKDAVDNKKPDATV